MRQISADAVLAFHCRRRFKRSNTVVKIVNGVPELWLFGNKIAWLCNNKLHWTMAGHPTVTTRERLNAILSGTVWQNNHTQYYKAPGWAERIIINPNEIYVEELQS